MPRSLEEAIGLEEPEVVTQVTQGRSLEEAVGLEQPSFMRRGATAEIFGPGGPPSPEVVIPRLIEALKQGALPTIGAAAGGIGGGLISLPAGGTGAIPGTMAGSALGEYLNQLLGITEPSGAQIALAGATPALPVVGRGLATGVKGLARRGVGLFAPQVAREEIIPGVTRAVRAVPGRIKAGTGPKTGEELFDIFREPGVPDIPLPNTSTFTAKLVKEAAIPSAKTPTQVVAGQISQALEGPGVAEFAGFGEAALAQIQREIGGTAGALPIGHVQSIMSRLDRLAGSPNTTVSGQSRNILRNIYQDLKAAPPEAKNMSELLLKNRAIWRERRAADTLTKWLQPGGTVIKSSPGGTLNINLGRLKDLIDRDEYFRGGLSKNSRADLEATLNWAFRATKRLPKPEEGAIGRFVVSRALGAGAGMLTGLPPAIGGTIGLVAVPPLIAQAVQTAA